MRFLLLLVLMAGGAAAQMLNAKAQFETVDRLLELMDAAGVGIPDLPRQGNPLIEAAKRNRAELWLSPGQMSMATLHKTLRNVRAFEAMLRGVELPQPVPESLTKQMDEYRKLAGKLEAHFDALLKNRDTQVRSPDRDNLRRYKEANQNLAAPVAGKPRVVFYGDSITDGWRLQEYFADRDFVNRGISGQVTGEMLGRMKADVIDLKPEAFVLLAGTNDIARNVALETIENNVVMMAELAVAHKIKPILASILPAHDYAKDVDPRWEQSKIRPAATIRAFNEWLKAYCAKNGFTYLNYYDALLDGAGSLKKELAADGLHPNAAGYRLMAPLAVAAIDQALTPAPVAKKKK